MQYCTPSLQPYTYTSLCSWQLQYIPSQFANYHNAAIIGFRLQSYKQGLLGGIHPKNHAVTQLTTSRPTHICMRAAIATTVQQDNSANSSKVAVITQNRARFDHWPLASNTALAVRQQYSVSLSHTVVSISGLSSFESLVYDHKSTISRTGIQSGIQVV